jgi:hypothetical protein
LRAHFHKRVLEFLVAYYAPHVKVAGARLCVGVGDAPEEPSNGVQARADVLQQLGLAQAGHLHGSEALLLVRGLVDGFHADILVHLAQVLVLISVRTN